MKTDDYPDYKVVLGSIEGLRRGFTSGTAAQAAAAAAARYAVTGQRPERISLRLKDDLCFSVPVVHCREKDGKYTCGVVKDAGDDPDDTNGLLFLASLSIDKSGELRLRGGKGVGTVTRPGLPVSSGESAINPVPHRRILAAVAAELPEGFGAEIVIEVPEGGTVAAKTCNPRLGIEGGISIIGTSGIVEPKSEKAFTRSIALLISFVRRAGYKRIILTSGYVGEKYIVNNDLDPEMTVAFGDHLGFALVNAWRKGFRDITVPMHIGKLAKVAAGMFNTHSKYGDARLETLAALCGLCNGGVDLISGVMEAATAEEAAGLIEKAGFSKVFTLLADRAEKRTKGYIAKETGISQDNPELDALCLRYIVLDLSGRVLGNE